MNKLSKLDQEVLVLMSEGLADHQITRQLKITSQALQKSVDRIQLRAEQESTDAGRFYERALRKRSERALASSVTRMHALMDILPHAVLIVDGRNGTIKDFNEAACTLFGYSPQEMRQLTVEDLVSDAIRSIHHAYRLGFLINVRKREMGYHPPIAGVRKDGSTVEMAIGLTATTSDDDIMVVCTEKANWVVSEPQTNHAEMA